jgi:hypothetical protein
VLRSRLVQDDTGGPNDAQVIIGNSLTCECGEGNLHVILDAARAAVEQVCSGISNHLWPQIRRKGEISHQGAGNNLQMQVGVLSPSIRARCIWRGERVRDATRAAPLLQKIVIEFSPMITYQFSNLQGLQLALVEQNALHESIIRF